ncbi:MAG TPA: 2-oxoacid:acceptor oxidoreductase family protein, partial [Lentimicrobium sp.]|nr:2-oxoacid:acceptor oxidoreductase family protein [Lentimicrobium sp.]
MIRKIISTTASRLVIALLNLAIIWLLARKLGAEGVGTVSLVVLGISIIQMVSALVGGSALVYMVPRHPLMQLLMPAWIWAVVVSAAGSLLLEAAGQFGWYGLMTRSVGPQIRGGEALAMVRLSSMPVLGHGDRFDVLLALDWCNADRFV